MARRWLAMVASGVAIGVLLILIYASRPLADATHQQHYQRVAAVDSSAAAYLSLREEFSSGRRDVSRLALTVDALRTRLQQDQRAVQTAGNDAADDPLHRQYTIGLAAVVDQADIASQSLQTLPGALAKLRDEGPAVVQRLRETADGPIADNFYSLWLAVYEYGLEGAASHDDIVMRLQALKDSSASWPDEVSEMTRAMETVVATVLPLQSAIQSINAAGLDQAASALAAHYRARHQDRIAARDNARILLGLYSLLLFAGLSLIVYRLYRSHIELTQAHQQLQQVNTELEQRVEQRTQEMTKAYTDLQDSQVQLVQAEKMSSLGQLVAGISHEINTPLLYLQSNTTLNKEALLRIADFLDLSYQRLSPRRNPGESVEAARTRVVAGLRELRAALITNEVREELQEVIALIDDNLEGLRELTQLAQGLKDFSRLDRAPVDHFNINDGVERTLIIAKNMLKRNVEVTTDLGDVPPIYCAPSQINQVLLNLITNASQAIDGKGQISISTAVEGEYAVIRIQDTGVGISPEIMHKIRDPFFTTKEVGSGTGLGLSIVEEIVSKHNGRLEIDSVVGVGSTFSVYLPLSQPTARSAGPGLAAASAPAVATIGAAEVDNSGTLSAQPTDADAPQADPVPATEVDSRFSQRASDTGGAAEDVGLASSAEQPSSAATETLPDAARTTADSGGFANMPTPTQASPERIDDPQPGLTGDLAPQIGLAGAASAPDAIPAEDDLGAEQAELDASDADPLPEREVRQGPGIDRATTDLETPETGFTDNEGDSASEPEPGLPPGTDATQADKTGTGSAPGVDGDRLASASNEG